ncbi:MAG: hypothetical protein C5T88_02100 [Williamsoniiplasma luminosum]|uniref:Uncharacterized protein n=1 Tax=Williamsoniiplasma luminosum TaxID=214888 RepID=A0A2S0NK31_9MOLU|nr:MAG: hypothetical protein C5T88_02100 [Williamsoniiplasma luminosum]
MTTIPIDTVSNNSGLKSFKWLNNVMNLRLFCLCLVQLVNIFYVKKTVIIRLQKKLKNLNKKLLKIKVLSSFFDIYFDKFANHSMFNNSFSLHLSIVVFLILKI